MENRQVSQKTVKPGRKFTSRVVMTSISVSTCLTTLLTMQACLRVERFPYDPHVDILQPPMKASLERWGPVSTPVDPQKVTIEEFLDRGTSGYGASGKIGGACSSKAIYFANNIVLNKSKGAELVSSREYGATKEGYAPWMSWLQATAEDIGKVWETGVPGQAAAILTVTPDGKITLDRADFFREGVSRSGERVPIKGDEFQAIIKKCVEQAKADDPFPEPDVKSVQILGVFGADGNKTIRNSLEGAFESTKLASLNQAGLNLERLGYSDLAKKLYQKAESMVKPDEHPTPSMTYAKKMIEGFKARTKLAPTDYYCNCTYFFPPDKLYSGGFLAPEDNKTRPLLDDYFHDELWLAIENKLKKNDYDLSRLVPDLGAGAAWTSDMCSGNQSTPLELARGMDTMIWSLYDEESPDSLAEGIARYARTVERLGKEKNAERLSAIMKQNYLDWLQKLSRYEPDREIRKKAGNLYNPPTEEK